MAKFLATLTILCVFCFILAKGFDKQAAIENFMAKMNDCKAEVGAKDADTEELLSKNPASTMEGKCLRSCVMKKYGVMDNNGKFVPAIAISYFESYTDGAEDKMKIAKEIIDACADIKVPADHCEAAEQYGKCFKEQAVAHGLKDEF